MWQPSPILKKKMFLTILRRRHSEHRRLYVLRQATCITNALCYTAHRTHLAISQPPELLSHPCNPLNPSTPNG